MTDVSLRLCPRSGNSLITLTFHLLNQYGLVELFQLDMVKLWRFLVMVQEDYHSDNPYHNAVHAADVTQAMYCYLREPMVGTACKFLFWGVPFCETAIKSVLKGVGNRCPERKARNCIIFVLIFSRHNLCVVVLF